MADTNIRFRLGSTFEGEGFKQAQKAIRENNKEIQASVRGLGSLTSAVAEISPEAATAVSAVKGIGSAFVTGGIVGGAIQLAIQGIGLAISAMKDYLNEAAERASKYAEVVRNKLVEAFGSARKEFENMRYSINQASKEADDMLKVLNGEAAHEAQTKIFEIQQKKFQDLVDAGSEEQKKLISATADLAIATEKAQLAITQAANTVDANQKKVNAAAELKQAADERLIKATNTYAELQNNCSEYLKKRQEAENYILSYEQRFADGEIGLFEVQRARRDYSLWVAKLEEQYGDQIKALNAAKDAEAAASREASEASYALKQCEHALTEAKVREEEATKSATITKLEGELKIKEANDGIQKALEEEAKAREEAAEKARKIAAAQDKEADASEKVAKAKEKQAAEIEGKVGSGGSDKDKKSVNEVKVANAKDIGSSVSSSVNVNGLRSDINKPRGLEDKAYDNIRKGHASVADWKAYDRMAARDERTSGARERIVPEITRYLQLAMKPDSWLSTSDKEFMETFKSRVIPQLTEAQAREFLGEAKGKILTTMKMEQLLKSDAIIRAWSDKFATK